MDAEALASSFTGFLQSVSGDGSVTRPSHRVPFHWPPHPVSKDFHILASDWTGRSTLDLYDETFEVEIARTAQGTFGRLIRVWNEAKAPDLETVLSKLAEGAEPYFRRQLDIGTSLGTGGRFKGQVSQLGPLELLKLLYCPNRDVAHESQLHIETHASSGLYWLSLVSILEDTSHPGRRGAQWCVLDMFEDLPSFCPTEASQERAISAIKGLMWSAEDDYARTIYKAGVVLGGHVCTGPAAEALLACVTAPSKYGRRSAQHAVFHLAEWMPDYRDRVLAALKEAASDDPEPLLRDFSASMAKDVESMAYEHMTEPLFEDENL